MIINKTYIKRPYITPACRVGEMQMLLTPNATSIKATGGTGTSGTGPGGNPSWPPFGVPAKSRDSFWSSENRFTEEY